MAPTNLKKAQKAKADALKNLGLIQDQATTVLDDADRLTHSKRIPQCYLSKLQLATEQYKASMKALIAVLEDKDQISTYTVKLTKQLAELDIFLKKLRAAVKKTDLEDNIETPAQIDKNDKWVFSYMQMRVQSTEKIIDTKL